MIIEKFKNSIYPNELAISSDDKSDQQVNYLDLNLEIKNHSIIHKIYDKRDKFAFPIINFPNRTGNVPKATPMVCSLHNLFGTQEDANYIQILNQACKLS